MCVLEITVGLFVSDWFCQYFQYLFCVNIIYRGLSLIWGHFYFVEGKLVNKKADDSCELGKSLRDFVIKFDIHSKLEQLILPWDGLSLLHDV
jgi:hypothetical protein